MGINTRNKQRGLTLLEVIASLALMAMVTVGIANLIQIYTSEQRALKIAEQMKVISSATERYVRDNYLALVGVATPTSPARITVGELISSGFLMDGFPADNYFQQTYCVLIHRTAANDLHAFVVSTGGNSMTDGELRDVANGIGAAGGAMYSQTTTFGTGLVGHSYAISNPATLGLVSAGTNCTATGAVAAGGVNLVAGHPVLAMTFNQDEFDAGVLYRNAIAGRPELNRMNTDLDMNSNDVQNADNVYVNNDVIAGNQVVTGSNIVSNTGDIIAASGRTISRDAILTDVTVGGAPVRGSQALYHGRVLAPNTTIPKPSCPSGQTPLIYGSPVSTLYLNASNEAEVTFGYVTTGTDMGASWLVNLYVLTGDGTWQQANAAFSRISVLVKCS